MSGDWQPTPPGMHRFLEHGRLRVMNGEWLPGGADNDTGTDRVLGGRYRLISQVGTGGMAVVWRAYDDVLARTVAVKVLAAHYADDPQWRDRIRREAQAAAVLSHPNIAQVYDYGEADIGGEIIPYVVMELIRGHTLHQRLNDGPVLPGYAMRVCAEIAAALAAAHAEGLAHRDIKPANVMLAPTGAKVVDFGIAAAIRPPGSRGDAFEVLGTPAYLAPERLLHDAVEPASDVYALGVLLYRLLAGHSPWTSETTTQMLSAHIYLEPALLMPMFQVPDYVTALCNRCLAKDPTRRPSAREVATLLAHGAGLQVVTDEPPAREQAAIDPEPSVLIRAPGSAAVDPHPSDVDAETVSRTTQQADAEPVALPPDPGHEPSSEGRNRARYALAAVALLAAVAATLWLLPAAHQDATQSAPETHAPGLAPAPVASRAAVNPRRGPSQPGILHPIYQRPGPTTGIPAVTASIATAPTARTAAPEPTSTTTVPAPSERTLSSAAGSVRATCPASDTAQILSWSAVKPYKVAQGDKEAGLSPAVSFKHGNTLVTMTVTCSGGLPSATST
jgi:eukaryotic-like serine/threonine-protein kinase